MADTNETTRTPGETIDFPGKGRAVIDWINNGWIGYRLLYDAAPDNPVLEKMTPADFEESVAHTMEQCLDVAAQTPGARP